MDDPQNMAAFASLANTGSPYNYLVWFNDGSTNQLDALTPTYNSVGQPFTAPSRPKLSDEPDKKSDLVAFGPSDVPSGNIVPSSALTATPYGGTLNVYGVLNGNQQGDLLVCRLSPAFTLLNVGSPPLVSPFSIAACGDGQSNGYLFFLGYKTATNIRLEYLNLPGDSSTPIEVSLSLQFNSSTYLGAAYGVVGKHNTAKGYCVVQDSDGVLHCCSHDSSYQAQINGSQVALVQTPIACLFLGTRLVVYWFAPVSGGSTSGSPLMRGVLSDVSKGFSVQQVTNAFAPNGYTQMTAFINPSSVSTDQSQGTALITYIQLASNTVVTQPDQLSF